MVDRTTDPNVIQGVKTELGYLGEYLFEMFMDLSKLEAELERSGSLEKFPRYDKLKEINREMPGYMIEGVKDKYDAESLTNFLLDIYYNVVPNIENYKESPLRKHNHIKDDLGYALEECDDMKDDIRASLEKIHKVYEALPERKGKMMEGHDPEVTVLASILMAGLLIFSLKAGSIVSTVGYASAPTSAFSSGNFELFYFITSSMILGIYILGKAMKKW